MVMKKFTGLPEFLSKRTSSFRDGDASEDVDTPEANATRAVKQFCQSGSSASSGEEVLHLPVIVESAESAPQAAANAANQIRKFLSKDNYNRPPVQYNAIMLIRILADNPGPSFTRNVDTKFVHTVKDLLRQGKDPSVQQILRETLVALDAEKAYDTNLNALFAMWRRECAAMTAPPQLNAASLNAPVFTPNMPGQPPPIGMGPPRPKTLPPPAELAARIEEARTSGKLLLQLVQSTSPSELQRNDLVKEFSLRCGSAARSIEGYIMCDNPPPDEDTMLTLIETSEQLSLATSKHHRAVLQARRETVSATASPPTTGLGSGTASPPLGLDGARTPSPMASLTSASALPPRQGYVPPRQEYVPPRQEYVPPPVPPVNPQRSHHVRQASSEAENPFADHHATETHHAGRSAGRRVENPASPSSLYASGPTPSSTTERERYPSRDEGTVISQLDADEREEISTWNPEDAQHRENLVSPMEVRTVTYRY